MLACIFHVTESTLSLNLGSWKARKLQLAKRLLAALWTLSPKSLVLQWSTEPNSIWRGEFFIEFIHELSEPVVLMYQNDSDWINPKKKWLVPKKYNSRGDPLLESSWSGSTCRPRWLRSCQWSLDLSFASHSHLATRSWDWCPWCVSG